MFTALAHPVRRRILVTLNFEGGSMTAGEIADMFEHAWPTTTRHIRCSRPPDCSITNARDVTASITSIGRRLKLVRDWLAWFSKEPNRQAGGTMDEGDEEEMAAKKTKTSRPQKKIGRADPVPHQRRGRQPR